MKEWVESRQNDVASSTNNVHLASHLPIHLTTIPTAPTRIITKKRVTVMGEKRLDQAIQNVLHDRKEKRRRRKSLTTSGFMLKLFLGNIFYLDEAV